MCDTLLIALNNYKNKQENLRKLYGKKYHYYHLEEVKNKHGKVIEYRIVETNKKSIKMYHLDLVFTKRDGTYIGTDIVKYPYKVIHNEYGEGIITAVDKKILTIAFPLPYGIRKFIKGHKSIMKI